MTQFDFLQKKDIEEAITKLDGNANYLSFKVYSLLIKRASSFGKSSLISIFPEYNRCEIKLNSDSKESAEFKIDIFSDYYDLFVNEEEVTIQQIIVRSGESYNFIKDLLKSRIQEVIIENRKNRVIRKHIEFYLKNKKIYSIGNSSFSTYFLNTKLTKTLFYEPWIIE